MEISINFFWKRISESIMAELVYTVQAIEHYMEISIDNLLQTISERNLIQGIGHYSRNFHRFLVAKNI